LPEEPPGTYFICPVCFWEDDALNFENPDEDVGGPNGVSLNHARANYRAFGAAERKDLHHVRQPRAEELPR
jgi:hypothetical protein